MNSKTAIVKTGRKKSHRESLQINLLNDLIVYEYLTTTTAKSGLVIGEFDKLVAIATGPKIESEKRRVLMQQLKSENSVAKLLEVYAKRFANEATGLVKTYRVGNRKGDNAEMIKLMVKGYVYKEIGKQVKQKGAPAKPKQSGGQSGQDKNKSVVTAQRGATLKEQVTGGAATAKVKTRSGI